MVRAAAHRASEYEVDTCREASFKLPRPSTLVYEIVPLRGDTIRFHDMPLFVP